MNDDPVPGKPAAASENCAEIPGTEPRASGRDGYPENETGYSCSNMEFDGFDAQPEYLSGHGQEYIKLSTGPFRGSGYLGKAVFETVSLTFEARTVWRR